MNAASRSCLRPLPLLLLLSLAAANPTLLPAQPTTALDPLMGLYEGAWSTDDSQKSKIRAQIRALGDHRYDGFVHLEHALKTVAVIHIRSTAGAAGTPIRLTGESKAGGTGELLPRVQFTGELADGRLNGTLTGELGAGKLQAEKVVRKPESLGAKPPANAIVLFDGRDTSHWQSFPWKITPEGAMQVVKGDIHAKDSLESFRLHIEFRTPFMPKQTGQARGNSGVYLQRRYEVQVLDSFGLYPLRIDDCGSIYGVQTTTGNACLPPGEWQTYDITYLAGDAARKEGPSISVVHNGVLVIDRARVPWSVVEKGTTGGDAPRDGGMLKLQDHGDPVEYRNIWAVPIQK